MDKGLIELTTMCQSKDWFNNVELNNNRYVIKTNYINHEALTLPPLAINGRQVVVHFASHYNLSKSNFTQTVDLRKQDQEIDLNTDDLETQLFIMETAIGGKTNLLDLLFEMQDGDSALTDLSEKFPKVRAKMEMLFEEFGFDILHDQLSTQ